MIFFSGVNDENLGLEERELLLSDFDIAETLRHSVIPRAIIYYTGEGIEDDDDYDEDLDDEDFDDFDEDEDEFDEDDDDDEEGIDGDSERASNKKAGCLKSKSAAGSRGKGKGLKKEVPPECKQQ